MKGAVEDFAAMVRGIVRRGLLVFDEGGNVELIMDTGFNEWLALPRLVIRRMKVRLEGRVNVTLADGKQVKLRVFTGRVRVGARRIEVPILEAEGLVGMQFMAHVGSKLEVDFQKSRWWLRR